MTHCKSFETFGEVSHRRGIFGIGSFWRNVFSAKWFSAKCHAPKTKAQISFAVNAKLISAFVFATGMVQFLFFLNPKFQASIYLVTARAGLRQTWSETLKTAFLASRLKSYLERSSVKVSYLSHTVPGPA